MVLHFLQRLKLLRTMQALPFHVLTLLLQTSHLLVTRVLRLVQVHLADKEFFKSTFIVLGRSRLRAPRPQVAGTLAGRVAAVLIIHLT